MSAGRARRFAMALAAGPLLLVTAGCGSGSIREVIASNYEFVREDRNREGVSRTYHSDLPPSRTAADITAQLEPGDRRLTGSGIFLRYANDFVGVVPDGRGGSRVFLDDERRGYAHFYPFVGGWWGSYSGRAESFRGGGPGAGK